MIKTSALERELIGNGLELVGSFKGFQIWAKGNRRALYDLTERKVCLTYTENEDIYKYINKWSEIKKRER